MAPKQQDPAPAIAAAQHYIENPRSVDRMGALLEAYFGLFNEAEKKLAMTMIMKRVFGGIRFKRHSHSYFVLRIARRLFDDDFELKADQYNDLLKAITRSEEVDEDDNDSDEEEINLEDMETGSSTRVLRSNDTEKENATQEATAGQLTTAKPAALEKTEAAAKRQKDARDADVMRVVRSQNAHLERYANDHILNDSSLNFGDLLAEIFSNFSTITSMEGWVKLSRVLCSLFTLENHEEVVTYMQACRRSVTKTNVSQVPEDIEQQLTDAGLKSAIALGISDNFITLNEKATGTTGMAELAGYARLAQQYDSFEASGKESTKNARAIGAFALEVRKLFARQPRRHGKVNDILTIMLWYRAMFERAQSLQRGEPEEELYTYINFEAAKRSLQNNLKKGHNVLHLVTAFSEGCLPFLLGTSWKTTLAYVNPDVTATVLAYLEQHHPDLLALYATFHEKVTSKVLRGQRPDPELFVFESKPTGLKVGQSMQLQALLQPAKQMSALAEKVTLPASASPAKRKLQDGAAAVTKKRQTTSLDVAGINLNDPFNTG